MGVLAFCAKGLELYSIGDKTPSCLFMWFIWSSQCFWKRLEELQISDPLEKSSLHIYLAVFWIFKILHVFKNQETIIPPKKLKDPASLTSYSMWLPLVEANWWRSNLDCVWALQWPWSLSCSYPCQHWAQISEAIYNQVHCTFFL